MPSIRTRLAYDRITLARTEAEAKANMPDIAPQIVNADYTGTVLAGQLPLVVQAYRFDGNTDVTEESAWSASLESGEATIAMDADEGHLTVSALAASSTVEVTSEHDGIVRSRIVPIELVIGEPPPSSGAGSSSAYDSSIVETTSASYGSANAGPMELTCGASGDVVLSAPLEFLVNATGSFDCWGKWQVSAAGAGTWSDVDTEIASDVPATYSGPGERERGAITVNQTATGLTPTTAYDFQLLLRNDSGTETHYFVGTATATTE